MCEVPLLSVIVPIYNLENYLSNCLDSLLQQSYSSWEAILIDDGSTDNSRQIIDMYCEKDSRFVAVYSENKGVSHARNLGLSHAKGEYVTFVDGDDWIEPEMFSVMMKYSSEDVDAVLCRLRRKNELSSQEIILKKLKSIVKISGRNGILSAYFSRRINNTVTAKIFRKSSLDGISFNHGLTVLEDEDFIFSFYQIADSLLVIPIGFYHYVRRETSACNQPLHSGYFHIFKSIDYEKSVASESEAWMQAVTKREVNNCINYYGLIRRSGRCREQIPMLKERIKNNFASIKKFPGITKKDLFFYRLFTAFPGIADALYFSKREKCSMPKNDIDAKDETTQ